MLGRLKLDRNTVFNFWLSEHSVLNWISARG
jgi:hypothetical protein